MQKNLFIVAAGISGAFAVAAGAIGAHAIVHRTDSMKDVWKTASNYHLIHSCILATVALSTSGTKRIICGTLFITGICLFSGSCYMVVLMNERKPYSYPAPLGGLCLISGWIALALL